MANDVQFSLKYNEKMFDGIDVEKARKELYSFMYDLVSGTTGNPLYAHWAEGQIKWDEDDLEYADYKESRHGSTQKFVLTGNALEAIKARKHPSKKIRVAWRKKRKQFVMTVALVKKVGKVNAYQIAQQGRFQGLNFTSGGKKKSITSDQWHEANREAYKKFGKENPTETTATGKRKKAAYKAKYISEKFGIDKGSSKRVGRNERLIASNLPGDHKFVTASKTAEVAEEIIKKSGYKLT